MARVLFGANRVAMRPSCATAALTVFLAVCCVLLAACEASPVASDDGASTALHRSRVLDNRVRGNESNGDGDEPISDSDKRILMRGKIALMLTIGFATLGCSLLPWWITRLKRSLQIMRVACCFAAGIILGAAFSHMLPDSEEAWDLYFELAGKSGLLRPDDSEYPFAQLISVFVLLTLLAVDKLLIARGIEGRVGQGHGHAHGGNSHGHSHAIPTLPEGYSDEEDEDKSDALLSRRSGHVHGDVEDGIGASTLAVDVHADESDPLLKAKGEMDEDRVSRTSRSSRRSRRSVRIYGEAFPSTMHYHCHDNHIAKLYGTTSREPSLGGEIAVSGDHRRSVSEGCIPCTVQGPCEAVPGPCPDTFSAIAAVTSVSAAIAHEGSVIASYVEGARPPDAATLLSRDVVSTAPSVVTMGTPAHVAQAWIFFTALSIHGVMDGLGLGAENNVDGFYGMLIAVASHKCLDGFALGVPVYFARLPRAHTVFALVFCSLMTPMGIGIGWAATSAYHGASAQLAKAIAVSMSTGSFYFISLVELLPGGLADGSLMVVKITALFFGWGIMAVLALWV